MKFYTPVLYFIWYNKSPSEYHSRIKPNTHCRRRRRNCRVESRRRQWCEHNSQLAHDDCRPPNRLYNDLSTWILIDIDNVFNNDVIMLSLVTSSTGNCKLGQDCRRCVHTADKTQLDSWVALASALCTGHYTVDRYIQDWILTEAKQATAQGFRIFKL